MLVSLRSRVVLPTGNNPLYCSKFRSNIFSKSNFCEILNINSEMGARPMCPSCSKPTRICLCNRFKTPILDNSVGVTILQHILEKKHPLNSTRIATLGLKNLNVEWVSDVNFEARFDIRMIQPRNEVNSVSSTEKNDGFWVGEMGSDGTGSMHMRCLSFGIEKYGGISSINHEMVTANGKQKVGLDHILGSQFPFGEGFIVRKLQRRRHSDGTGDEECESVEFEMEVPAGSVLLFPSEKAVGPEEINFDVRNLIVLDGTWAKATRMYNENPWLKPLPHLKLDLDQLSLYGEVRHQPRAGYLSTIESIVYALKAVGENPEGLDGLLDVFASMVGDQRRCKDERLSQQD